MKVVILAGGLGTRISEESHLKPKRMIETLSAHGNLVFYKHNGFWQCMDTQQDKVLLESMLRGGNAPWKIWEG